MAEIIVSGGDGVVLSVDGTIKQSITVNAAEAITVNVSSTGPQLEVQAAPDPNTVTISDNSDANSVTISEELPVQVTVVERGLKGERGADGAPGATGATGQTGATGSAGTTYTPAVTVSGLAAGSDPTANVTVEGSIATFSFAIPEGAQGPTGSAGTVGSTGATGQTGATGSAGTTYTPEIGTITTIAPGSTAAATVVVSGSTATFNFSIPRGTAGSGVNILGSVATEGDLPASGSSGDAYLISGNLYVWDGDSWEDVGNIQGPPGIQGTQGTVGATGATGQTGATGSAGTTYTPDATATTLAAGADATASVSVVGSTATYSFGIPRGAQGTAGETGATGQTGATGSAGTTFTPNVIVSTLAAGATATGTVTSSAEEGVATYTFGIPRGADGTPGATGETGATGSAGTTFTPVIGVVTTTSVGVPASATVTVSGTTATFGFVIPKGQDGLNGENGENGPPGPPPDIGESTVTTLEPGATATVQTTYNSPTATFEFGIPRGATGSAGTTYTPAVSVSSLEPDQPASASVTIDGSTATFNFGIPRGATGSAGTGGTATNEVLDSAITVFVPDAAGEFIFGKFKHGQTIEVGDGDKTALDIIKEALFAYSDFDLPTVTYTPTSSPSGANNFDVDIDISVTNHNYAAGVTATIRVYQDTGDGFNQIASHSVTATPGLQEFQTPASVNNISAGDQSFYVSIQYSEGETTEEVTDVKTYTESSDVFDEAVVLSSTVASGTNNKLSNATTTATFTITGTNVNHALGATAQAVLLASTDNGNTFTPVATSTAIATEAISFSTDYDIDLSNAGNSGFTRFKAEVTEFVDGSSTTTLPSNNTLSYYPLYAAVTAPAVSGNPSPSGITPPTEEVIFTGTFTNPNAKFGATNRYRLRQQSQSISGSYGTNVYTEYQDISGTTSVLSVTQDVDLTGALGKRYKWVVDPSPAGLSTDQSNSWLTYSTDTQDVTATLNVTPSSTPQDDLVFNVSATATVTNPNTEYSQTVSALFSLQYFNNGQWTSTNLGNDAVDVVSNSASSSFTLSSTGEVDFRDFERWRFSLEVTPSSVYPFQGSFTVTSDEFTPNITQTQSQPTLAGSPTPSNIDFNDASPSVDFTSSFTFANDAVALANLSVTLQQSSLNGFSYSDVAGSTQTFTGSSVSYAFNNHEVPLSGPGGTRRYRLKLTQNIQGVDPIYSSNILTYTYKTYQKSQILTPSSTPGKPHIYQSGYNSNLAIRHVYDGNSDVSFRIKKNTAAVDLDRVVVFRTINGSSETIVYSEDISNQLVNQTGNFQVSFTNDAGGVELGDVVKYNVYIWDDVTASGSTPWPGGTLKTGKSDNQFEDYSVLNVIAKVVATTSTTALNNPDNAVLQSIYNTNNSSKTDIDSVYVANDYLNGTEDLNFNASISSITNSDRLYWFIPSLFFNWHSEATVDPDDFSGASETNDFITFTIDGNPEVIQNLIPGETGLSYTNAGGIACISVDELLVPNSFASSSEKIEFIVFHTPIPPGQALINKPLIISNE